MTEVLVISEDSLQQAARILKIGGLVAFPTDTVYGLGCDPFNPQALVKLLAAKKRASRALPLLIDSLDTGKRIGTFDKRSLLLARRFWPGPLTIIVRARVGLPNAVTGSTETVGLRMPSRPDTLELIEEAGGVLVGTSANISGQEPARSASEVLAQLDERADLILDGGTCLPGRESTVVRLDGDRVAVIREGAIAKETIIATLDQTNRPEL